MSNPEMLAANVVKVGEFVYIFDNEDDAQAFFDCVAENSVEFCAPSFTFTRLPIAEYEPPSSSDNEPGGGYRM